MYNLKQHKYNCGEIRKESKLVQSSLNEWLDTYDDILSKLLMAINTIMKELHNTVNSERQNNSQYSEMPKFDSFVG